MQLAQFCPHRRALEDLKDAEWMDEPDILCTCRKHFNDGHCHDVILVLSFHGLNIRLRNL